MTEELDRPTKSHRLAIGAAGAVLVVALGAPLAGAAGVQLPPIPTPSLPEPRVEEPALPAPQLPPVPDLPGVPELPTHPDVVVPEVTTLPVPVEGLDEVTEPVGGIVDDLAGDAGSVVDEITGGAVDTVDEVTGGAVDTVDEVTGGGPVGDVVDEVTGGGTVGGVVDEVTGGAGGVVDEVVDTVDGATDPVEEVVDTVTGGVKDVTDEAGNNATTIVDKVNQTLGGLTGDSSVGVPTLPGADGSAPGATLGGGGRTPDVAGVQTRRELAGLARTISPDGFAGTDGLAAPAPAAAASTARDGAAPSMIERIARSAAGVAERLAFPMLLAFAVGAFVLLQNRVDRKDPKLALAALDADEELLGFE